MVRVRCRGQGEEELGVGGQGPSLLGQDWLDRVRLDWREIHSVDTTINATFSMLEAVLPKHSSLFRNELGIIREMEVKLHVSPGAKPRFYRSRSIPYALRSKVDQALERLVSEGILEALGVGSTYRASGEARR